jgi:hypothetical protein
MKLSSAQGIEIDLSEPRQDHRVLKLAGRRTADPGEATAPAWICESDRAARSAAVAFVASVASPAFRSFVAVALRVFR